MDNERNNYILRLCILILSTTIFRLIYITHIDLSPDEAYYWDLSRRLQLSYYDHPPMLMYLIRISTEIFGNSVFAVRFPVVLISVLVTALVYKIGQELFDGRTGFYAALLCNICMIYSVGGVIATIDTPLGLFWLGTIYAGIMALKKAKGGWWYSAGIFAGLGLMSKYTMVLIAPPMLLVLLLSKEHRFWLKRKEPYLALCIAALFFLPVLIWNFQHEWVSFGFQLAHGLKVKKRSGVGTFLDYLGGQAAVLGPFMFAGCLWAIVKSIRVWVADRDWRYIYLSAFSAFVLIFFGYSSFRAKVEGNWPMPAYFTAVISMVSLYLINDNTRKRAIATVVIITASLITILAHVQAVHPIIKVNNDPTDQLHGWNRLGGEVSDVYQSYLKSAASNLTIMSDSPRLASELAFYMPDNPDVYEVRGSGKFNQYNMWKDPEIGTDALLLGGRNKEVELIRYFGEVRYLKDVELMRGEKVINRYSIYYCRSFKGF